MELYLKVIARAEKLQLQKLSKNYDETQYHAEYDIRKNTAETNFTEFMKIFHEVGQKSKLPSLVLSAILITYKELQSEGPWKLEQSKDYLQKLNTHFSILYGMTLENVLKSEGVCNNQEVFDGCLQNLHQKLTPEAFKRYPSLIEAYVLLIKDVKDYNVTLNPLKTLPVSLLLIDDYITENKIKGLKCCNVILKDLSPTDFKTGNYYEVLYGSLMKVMQEKDLEITKLVVTCFLELLKLLPSDAKIIKTEDLYSNLLDQLYTESNLYRKAKLFYFTKKIIDILKVKCVKRKQLKVIFHDNIDICCNEAVGEILLNNVLVCMETWLKYCWCTWRLCIDHNLLSIMFKILYVTNSDQVLERIQNIIITMINLCPDYEKELILNSLANTSLDSEFQLKIDSIKVLVHT